MRQIRVIGLGVLLAATTAVGIGVAADDEQIRGQGAGPPQLMLVVARGARALDVEAATKLHALATAARAERRVWLGGASREAADTLTTDEVIGALKTRQEQHPLRLLEVAVGQIDPARPAALVYIGPCRFAAAGGDSPEAFVANNRTQARGWREVLEASPWFVCTDGLRGFEFEQACTARPEDCPSAAEVVEKAQAVWRPARPPRAQGDAGTPSDGGVGGDAGPIGHQGTPWHLLIGVALIVSLAVGAFFMLRQPSVDRTAPVTRPVQLELRDNCSSVCFESVKVSADRRSDHKIPPLPFDAEGHRSVTAVKVEPGAEPDSLRVTLVIEDFAQGGRSPQSVVVATALKRHTELEVLDALVLRWQK